MKKIERFIIIFSIISIIILGLLINILLNETNSLEKEQQAQNNTTIVKNGVTYKSHNAVLYQTVSDKQMCQTYFDTYKKLMLNSPKEAYELLDEQYRNKRFPNIYRIIKNI